MSWLIPLSWTNPYVELGNNEGAVPVWTSETTLTLYWLLTTEGGSLLAFQHFDVVDRDLVAGEAQTIPWPTEGIEYRSEPASVELIPDGSVLIKHETGYAWTDHVEVLGNSADVLMTVVGDRFIAVVSTGAAWQAWDAGSASGGFLTPVVPGFPETTTVDPGASGWTLLGEEAVGISPTTIGSAADQVGVIGLFDGAVQVWTFRVDGGAITDSVLELPESSAATVNAADGGDQEGLYFGVSGDLVTVPPWTELGSASTSTAQAGRAAIAWLDISTFMAPTGFCISGAGEEILLMEPGNLFQGLGYGSEYGIAMIAGDVLGVDPPFILAFSATEGAISGEAEEVRRAFT